MYVSRRRPPFGASSGGRRCGRRRPAVPRGGSRRPLVGAVASPVAPVALRAAPVALRVAWLSVPVCRFHGVVRLDAAALGGDLGLKVQLRLGLHLGLEERRLRLVRAERGVVRHLLADAELVVDVRASVHRRLGVVGAVEHRLLSLDGVDFERPQPCVLQSDLLRVGHLMLPAGVDFRGEEFTRVVLRRLFGVLARPNRLLNTPPLFVNGGRLRVAHLLKAVQVCLKESSHDLFVLQLGDVSCIGGFLRCELVRQKQRILRFVPRQRKRACPGSRRVRPDDGAAARGGLFA
mmetsp:Transcript_3960/g.12201  ORF Transcript_3960/g.12201 Transcript_3960/m.12201 type:complete len:291 (+) Transcript_3960:106-978(+)